MSEFSYLYNVLNVLPGLQDEYYDACMGYLPTVERIHYAHFTLPYATSVTSYMYTKHNNVLSLTDLRSKKIGKYPIF